VTPIGPEAAAGPRAVAARLPATTGKPARVPWGAATPIGPEAAARTARSGRPPAGHDRETCAGTVGGRDPDRSGGGRPDRAQWPPACRPRQGNLRGYREGP